MSITRWDPVADAIGLRQVMDSLLEQSFVRPRDDGGGGALGLAVDVEDRAMPSSSRRPSPDRPRRTSRSR
jgi:hypothetical protein